MNIAIEQPMVTVEIVEWLHDENHYEPTWVLDMTLPEYSRWLKENAVVYPASSVDMTESEYAKWLEEDTAAYAVGEYTPVAPRYPEDLPF